MKIILLSFIILSISLLLIIIGSILSKPFREKIFSFFEFIQHFISKLNDERTIISICTEVFQTNDLETIQQKLKSFQLNENSTKTNSNTEIEIKEQNEQQQNENINLDNNIEKDQQNISQEQVSKKDSFSKREFSIKLITKKQEKGIESIINKYRKELNKGKREERISCFEKFSSKNISDLVETESFFDLPLNTIFSIISQTTDDNLSFDIIKQFIEKTYQSHKDEKETIMILFYIPEIFLNSFTEEQLFDILQIFQNCNFIKILCDSHQENEFALTKDTSYETEQYEQKVEKIMNIEKDIFQAIKEGKINDVKYLIEKNNSDYMNKKDQRGDSIIEFAILNGQLEIVKLLLNKNQKLIHFKGEKQWTLLHFACYYGQKDIAQYLIENGINKEVKDVNLRTPLHLASSNDKALIVKFLLNEHKANIEAPDYKNKTPLHLSCENGCDDAVHELLMHNANIEAEDSEKKTPLFYACMKNHFDIAKLLIDKGAKINIEDQNGFTPIDFAKQCSNPEMVDYLTKKLKSKRK